MRSVHRFCDFVLLCKVRENDQQQHANGQPVQQVHNGTIFQPADAEHDGWHNNRTKKENSSHHTQWTRGHRQDLHTRGSQDYDIFVMQYSHKACLERQLEELYPSGKINTTTGTKSQSTSTAKMPPLSSTSDSTRNKMSEPPIFHVSNFKLINYCCKFFFQVQFMIQAQHCICQIDLLNEITIGSFVIVEEDSMNVSSFDLVRKYKHFVCVFFFFILLHLL